MRELKIENLPHTFVIFDTIGDGSCFLHSILMCFNKKYRKSNIKERQGIVDQLRRDLADVLYEKNEEDKTYYEILSRGEITELSKFIARMKQDVMSHYLKTRRWLDIFYLEMISNHLDIDIIIYDEFDKKFYNTGDLEIYHKGRNTIFINYQREAHFEAMGIKLDKIRTFFDSECSIVKEIKQKFYKKSV